ncbi:MAG: 30S ribosomal protein S1 [Parasporobacterium sp.]|nr:30S ribosomal protein S1 [Parasporobacterium sp.]
MSEEMIFNDEMIDETIKSIRTGEIVEGTVLYVKPDSIALNIHYKYDGIITKDEYSNDPDVDLTAVVNAGDVLEAKVLKIQDNEVQLSYKRINEERANKRVEEAFENKEVLTVKVEKITTGGLITTFEDASIFVPASLVSDTFEKNLDKYLGQEIEVVITEFNPRKRRVIGNRRKLLQATRAERAKELLESLQADDIVEGEVKSVTAFGAFIDLGGVDGLLHISEMSWGRVDSPKSMFKVGDKIRVYIKSIEDGKIALSAKFPEENPWKIAETKYQPGTIVTGKVARMTDFGAFIELEPGLDALLHVSQISKKHVKKPSDVLKQGQIIDAKVVDFKEEEKKISLSRRDFEDDLVPDEPAEEAAAEAVETAETVEAVEAVEAAPETAAE